MTAQTKGNLEKQFQSTLPVRGATLSRHGRQVGLVISIHAPREGSDGFHLSGFLVVVIFQSTLPVRGATVDFIKNNKIITNFNPRSP